MKNAQLKIATAALALTAASSASAVSYTTDFENFALGADLSNAPLISDPALVSNNWRGNGASGLANNGVSGSTYDGEIADTAGPNGKAYRLSNAKVSGNYDTTHAATPTVDLIGESTSSGTPGVFSFEFDFKSVSPTYQDGLSIDVTPTRAGSASRQGILRILEDSTNGLTVGWWEVLGNGGFNFVELASGLSRTDWHTISVDMTFADGTDNDSVSVLVNGTPTTGLKTWENYSGYAGAEAIDSVIFRVANPVDFNTNTGGVAALDGGGVYFDNLTVSAVPEPTSLALLGLGAAVLYRRRRS
jgi:hypothetical protein